jgi:hypothetical protein
MSASLSGSRATAAADARHDFSLIMGTLGRSKEIAEFIESLYAQAGPEGHRSVTPYTLFARAISYTIFASEAAVARAGFDEDFGVGAMFGAAEETDFLFAILSNGGRVIQSSGPRIFHPNKTQDFKDVQRVSSYNVGIGAYLVSNLKLLVRLAQFALTGNALKLRWYWLIFSNRHRGALRYLAHVRRRRAHQRHVPPYPPHADQ